MAALFIRYAPKYLLLVGASRLPTVEALIHSYPQCQLAHSPATTLPTELAGRCFDLALFVDYLEHLPQHTGLQLLAGVRNLNASRVTVLIGLETSD